jgi:hypothetical protein|nr:MAG TPA: hypothetical protein [Caudoviricetes sp.]
MALTTTEENQLRELLRRANATQNGKTADQLDLRSGGEFDFLITSKGSSISRTGATDLGVKLAGANIGTSGTNLTTANSNYNHLMTRDATRSEITRLTDSRISSAQGTADLAVTANNATLRFAQTTEQRALALEEWRNKVIDPSYSKKVGVIGNVYSANPVMQVGPLNLGSDLAARTYRFNFPLKPDPMIFFAVFGDSGYPRYDLIREGNRTVGFTLYHATSAGRWLALGEQA